MPRRTIVQQKAVKPRRFFDDAIYISSDDGEDRGPDNGVWDEELPLDRLTNGENASKLPIEKAELINKHFALMGASLLLFRMQFEASMRFKAEYYQQVSAPSEVLELICAKDRFTIEKSLLVGEQDEELFLINIPVISGKFQKEIALISGDSPLSCQLKRLFSRIQAMKELLTTNNSAALTELLTKCETLYEFLYFSYFVLHQENKDTTNIAESLADLHDVLDAAVFADDSLNDQLIRSNLGTPLLNLESYDKLSSPSGAREEQDRKNEADFDEKDGEEDNVALRKIQEFIKDIYKAINFFQRSLSLLDNGINFEYENDSVVIEKISSHILNVMWLKERYPDHVEINENAEEGTLVSVKLSKKIYETLAGEVGLIKEAPLGAELFNLYAHILAIHHILVVENPSFKAVSTACEYLYKEIYFENFVNYEKKQDPTANRLLLVAINELLVNTILAKKPWSEQQIREFRANLVEELKENTITQAVKLQADVVFDHVINKLSSSMINENLNKIKGADDNVIEHDVHELKGKEKEGFNSHDEVVKNASNANLEQDFKNFIEETKLYLNTFKFALDKVNPEPGQQEYRCRIHLLVLNLINADAWAPDDDICLESEESDWAFLHMSEVKRKELKSEIELLERNDSFSNQLFSFYARIAKISALKNQESSPSYMNNILLRCGALYDAIYQENIVHYSKKKDTKINETLLSELCTFLDATILNESSLSYQQVEQFCDQLDKKLYGNGKFKQVTPYIKALAWGVVGAVVGGVIGLIFGAAITALTGGWGAVPMALIGAFTAWTLVTKLMVGGAAVGIVSAFLSGLFKNQDNDCFKHEAPKQAKPKSVSKQKKAEKKPGVYQAKRELCGAFFKAASPQQVEKQRSCGKLLRCHSL